jgi:hypothetical protein
MLQFYRWLERGEGSGSRAGSGFGEAATLIKNYYSFFIESRALIL